MKCEELGGCGDCGLDDDVCELWNLMDKLTVRVAKLELALDKLRKLSRGEGGVEEKRESVVVSPKRLFALRHIAAHPGCTRRDISLTSPGGSYTDSTDIRFLIDAGLVMKFRSGQQHQLTITEAGGRFLGGADLGSCDVWFHKVDDEHRAMLVEMEASRRLQRPRQDRGVTKEEKSR
jgi:hypothetical protein